MCICVCIYILQKSASYVSSILIHYWLRLIKATGVFFSAKPLVNYVLTTNPVIFLKHQLFLEISLWAMQNSLPVDMTQSKATLHGMTASNECGRTGGQGLFWNLNLHVRHAGKAEEKSVLCLGLCCASTQSRHNRVLPSKVFTGLWKQTSHDNYNAPPQGDALIKAKKVNELTSWEL